ncbi:MAG: tetratricopeptide repeat protein [Thermoanaerobaculia bacterium]|nr:tetratricopeptide repeat protein [Thermoanaerobaculia bacterium]
MRRFRAARPAARAVVAVCCALSQGGALSAQPDLRPLLDFSDPAGTEARLRTHLEVAREGGDPGYLAEVLTQLARTYSRRGRFEEAHRQLDEVEAMLSPELPRASIRYRLERGRTLNLQGDREAALELFHQALELAESSGPDYLALDAAHMIAIAEPAFETQVEFTRKALSIAASSSDPETGSWVGPLTVNLGWTYFDHGDHAQALDCFERALAWMEAHRGPESQPSLAARWNVGRALRALERFEEALELQEALLAEYQRLTIPVYGYVYEELAELFLREGDPRAPEYFGLAFETLSKDVWMVNSQAERLARLGRLAALELRSPRP